MRPSVEVSQQSGVTLARVEGDLEAFTVSEVAPALHALQPAPRSALVVDLLGVTFLDSSGLSLLVELNRRTSELGARLRLVCAPSTLRLLMLTHMDQVLSLYASVADAVTDGAGSGPDAVSS
jgi:anti-sigma B factor antagonist